VDSAGPCQGDGSLCSAGLGHGRTRPMVGKARSNLGTANEAFSIKLSTTHYLSRRTPESSRLSIAGNLWRAPGDSGEGEASGGVNIRLLSQSRKIRRCRPGRLGDVSRFDRKCCCLMTGEGTRAAVRLGWLDMFPPPLGSSRNQHVVYPSAQKYPIWHLLGCDGRCAAVVTFRHGSAASPFF
jgi:hypothetical protein